MGGCAGSSPKREAIFTKRDRILGPGRARRYGDGDADSMSANITVSETTWSFSAWVKTTKTGTMRICGIYYGGQSDGKFQLFKESSERLRVHIESDAGIGLAHDFIASDLSDGDWHHVAGSVTTNQMYGWVDGVANPNNPQAHSVTQPTITQVGIGVDLAHVTPENWIGDLDEVSFWDGTLLTDAMALALYSLGMDNTKIYFNDAANQFEDASITAPTAHWSLSESLNPGSPGDDSVGSVDLTDNGTADCEGIPAGE